MNRTENLELCTWVESDPVSLTQMNENFTKLDRSGTQAIACANAASINAAGLLLHSRHAGQDISFARDAMVADLTHASDTAEYAQLCFTDAGAHLLSSGYAGETISIRDENGSNIGVSASVCPRKIWTFRPSGYASLTSIQIEMVSSSSAILTDQLSLYNGDTLVAKSLEYVKSDTSSVRSFTYTFQNVILDPNKSYDLYFDTNLSSMRTISTATITATPLIYTSGWLISPEKYFPEYRHNLHLNVYAGGTTPTVAYRLDGGAWKSISAYSVTPAVSQTGAACQLHSFIFAVTENSVLELRFTLPAADSVLYGYSAAIL